MRNCELHTWTVRALTKEEASDHFKEKVEFKQGSRFTQN